MTTSFYYSFYNLFPSVFAPKNEIKHLIPSCIRMVENELQQDANKNIVSCRNTEGGIRGQGRQSYLKITRKVSMEDKC